MTGVGVRSVRAYTSAERATQESGRPVAAMRWMAAVTTLYRQSGNTGVPASHSPFSNSLHYGIPIRHVSISPSTDMQEWSRPTLTRQAQVGPRWKTGAATAPHDTDPM